MEPGKEFLASTPQINWDTAEVLANAHALSGSTPVEIARSAFLFVRDQIGHSLDINATTVTQNAAEVLEQEHGFCYTKSFLLAALLRAREIPAGLCFQKLQDDEGNLILHSFNAIYLEPWGWVKVDARGNKPGVDAQFDPPNESLAFAPSQPGEETLPDILANPPESVVLALAEAIDCQTLNKNLPRNL